MKTVSLDVHVKASQLTARSEAGEILIEMVVPTQVEELRRVVGGIPGPKCLVMEQGPQAARLCEGLVDLVEEIIVSDPAHTALIACDENGNDREDARRLGQLAQVGLLHTVYVPPEPYRSLRSLLEYRWGLSQEIVRTKNRIKALCHRYGVCCEGKRIYGAAGRRKLIEALKPAPLRWQAEGLYGQMDRIAQELGALDKRLRYYDRKLPQIGRLRSLPGIGPTVARTLVAWIAEPWRFRSRSALCSYAGLGLGQGVTAWQPVGPARASRRGNRSVKRVLFIAARAVLRTKSRLAARYHAHREAGWGDGKARRELARTILRIAIRVWLSGGRYQESKVDVPTQKRASGSAAPHARGAGKP